MKTIQYFSMMFICFFILTDISQSYAQITREVEPFTGLHFKSAGQVIIRQGDSTSVVIYGCDDDPHSVTTHVAGGDLWISTSGTLLPEITVELIVSDLRRITLSGAGKIISEGVLKTPSLTVVNNGFGKISLDLIVRDLDTKVNGAGRIDLRGEAVNHHVAVNGVGVLKALLMANNHAVVLSNGLGMCELAVSDSLDVTINGLGSVHYLGEPHVSPQIKGLGKLKQL